MDFMSFVLYFFVFVLGLCVGSFLNVVIFRLKILNFSKRKNLRKKNRSQCPKCNHQLNWQDLFPVFSFLFLRGKCRYCKEKISWQYPLVELATGIIFLLVFFAQSSPVFNGNFLNVLNLIFLFYIVSVLIIIFVYDLKHYIIPDKILFPAIAITFFYQLFFNFALIGNYLIAVLVGAGFFLIIFFVSRGMAMGFGDVKLAILMGLLLGFPNILTALFLAFFFGVIISIILIIFYGKKMKSEIPFGPFLVLGTFLALFWGTGIINWYLTFFI